MINKRIEILYLFLLRLPEVLFINGIYALITTRAYQDFGTIKAFTFAVFIFMVLFAIRISVKNGLKGAGFQFLAGCLFLLANYLFNHTVHYEFLRNLLCIMTLHALALDTSQYKNAFLHLVIIFSAILAATMYSVDNAYLFRLFFLITVVSAACSHMGYQYSHMDFFIYSLNKGGHSRHTINRLVNRSLRLAAVYTLVITSMTAAMALTPMPQEVFTVSDFNVIIRGFGGTTAPETQTTPAPPEEAQKGREEEREETPGAAVTPFTYIAIIILVVLVVVLVLFFRTKPLLKPMEFNEEDEDLAITESLQNQVQARKRGLSFSYNQRVRRIFFNKAKQYMKKGVLANRRDTAKKMLDTMNTYEESDLLDDLYHVARYGNRPITQEEYQQLKKNES